MKLIIFDLDGVLIDSRDIHFDVLNKALSQLDSKYIISKKEHLTKYDGLSTRQKLVKLTKDKNLPESMYDIIWNNKQILTFNELDKVVTVNDKLISIFSYLKMNGFVIAIASNSIRKTIDIVINNSGISEFVDLIVSNEDVSYPKPNPQIYLTVMQKFGISPHETYIFEDSYIGRQSAFKSGATVCPVNNSTELTIDYVKECVSMNKNNQLKWENKKLNILIPMAGEGSRFSKAGYTFPKPIIEVNGEPMIKVVADNLNIEANFIFIIRKEHDDKFNISSTLKQIEPSCKIVKIDGLTDGAACTTLLAKEYIDSDAPLLIANSDQFIEWDSCEFYHSINTTIDGSIITFENVHPKWSYVKIDDDGNVTQVAEKEVISNKATVGIYYFSKGSDYVKYAESMIAKNIRYGQGFNGTGEFYVAPVYNEAIADGKIIKTFDIKKMHGLGTPEDLDSFIKNMKL
jgi:HAD superfamily hydrolase (TIGR01509 family)